MGANSQIEWTHHTFNSWEGCCKVGPECDHCYAEARAYRFGLNVWGPTAPRKPMSDAYWRQPLRWNQMVWQCDCCLQWFKFAEEPNPTDPCPKCWRLDSLHRRRPRVFCCSLADVFEGPETCQDPDAYAMICRERQRLWALIEATPNLDWLLLTKRPQHIPEFVPCHWMEPGKWPKNVWCGTSVGTQKMLDKRGPFLLQVPAPVLFFSMEPLLEHVDLSGYLPRPKGWKHYPVECRHGYDHCPICDANPTNPITWVIGGGEPRPVHPDWARSLRDQCKTAGIPFFWKQWGEWGPCSDLPDDIRENTHFPAPERDPERTMPCRYDHAVMLPDGTILRGSDIRYPLGAMGIYKVGKKHSGALIDGRHWREMPVPKDEITT